MNRFSYPKGTLSKIDITHDSFIIWANHPTMHEECTPGYAKLLLEMGYTVDIFMLENPMQETPLCRMQDTPSLSLHVFQDTQQILSALSSLSATTAGLMITTAGLFYPHPEVIQHTHKDISDHIKNLLSILKLPPFSELQKIAETFKNKIFVFHKTWQISPDLHPILGSLLVDNASLLFQAKTMPAVPMINPNYFGKIKTNLKNSKTRFITVGQIRKDKRNYNTLIDACTKLKEEGHDFEICIVGKGNISNIPETLHDNIKVMGELGYPEMYQLIESSDFYLPLLDSQVPDHQTYLSEKTTGGIQLIYGFEIPPVIESAFCDLHGFCAYNAVLYSQGEIYTGLLSAINTTQQEYNLLQQGMRELRESINKKSLKSLSSLLKK